MQKMVNFTNQVAPYEWYTIASMCHVVKMTNHENDGNQLTLVLGMQQ